ELALPKGEVHIFRAKLLWQAACHEHIRITHHGLAPVQLTLALRFDADFVDLFEVRGTARERRGIRRPARAKGHELLFGYRGLDGQERSTRVRLDPAPTAWHGSEARLDLALEP